MNKADFKTYMEENQLTWQDVTELVKEIISDAFQVRALLLCEDTTALFYVLEGGLHRRRQQPDYGPVSVAYQNQPTGDRAGSLLNLKPFNTVAEALIWIQSEIELSPAICQVWIIDDQGNAVLNASEVRLRLGQSV